MQVENIHKGRTVLIWKDLDALSMAAAHFFVTECNRCIQQNGRFVVALSGGSTPKKLYELLASPAFTRNVPWRRVFLFWSDERFVPHTDTESNYRMVKESLLERIDIPAKNVFPIPVTGPPEKAATKYEATIRKFFRRSSPAFDFLLLGVGEEGHTASLFPGSELLNEGKRWIKEVWVPQKQTHRVTFTLPIINKARLILFLVSGREKAAVISKVLFKKSTKNLLPVQMVRPTKGSTMWMLDEEAAGDNL
jgi:6-phosphogluconolactonase